MLPRTVRISGHLFTVREVPGSQLEEYGNCRVRTCTIQINEDLADSMKHLTLLHEVCHAIVAFSGLELGESQEESVVEAMSSGLFAVLRANPDLSPIWCAGEDTDF